MKSPVKAATYAAVATLFALVSLPLGAGSAHAVGDPTILSIEPTGRTDANVNGWNNDTVSVRWRCTWDDGTTYDITREVSDEGTDQSVTGTCEQPDGSRVQDTQDGINIDYTAPEIAFLGRTSANAAGWNKKPVAVRWTCTDDRSGVVSDTVSTTVATEGNDQVAQGTCTDLAGNTVTGGDVDRISVDLTAPYAELDSRTEPNDSGWNNTDVAVGWTCGDDMSGPAYDETTTTVSTEGEGVSAAGKCVDKAGNVFVPTESVNVDKTPPTTALTSRTPANARGWNNTPVDLGWTCTDAVSGAVAPDDSATLDQDGAGQSATGSCSDVAGNSSTNVVDRVNIDTVAPGVEWNASPADGGHYPFGLVPALTCYSIDQLSGPSTCTETDDSTTVGSHTVTATASDVAGNTTSEQRTFDVDPWTTGGFYGRRSGEKVAPRTVKQLNFQVYAGDKELTRSGTVGAKITQNQIACTSKQRIGTKVTLATRPAYSFSRGFFTAAWTAPSRKGCFAVRAELADGSRIYTSFNVG